MAEKRIISLSIEGITLRILSFYKGSIEAWDSIPFNPQFVTMGHVADPPGLGGVIKGALEERGLIEGRVVCAIPGLRTMSRVISVPQVAKKELAGVISREARRVLSIAEEDNYLHWQLLPAETDMLRVYVLAVPKEPLHALVEAIREAGLKPYAVDLKPLALMRAVNSKDAIIANGESNSVELVIVVDDVPTLARSVFLGEGVVSQDYAVGRISDEITRTIDFYNNSNPDNPLSPEVPIYLTGAAASGVSFALNVAALIGYPVQPLDPPLPYPEDLPVAEFMVNLGLILKVV